MGSIIIQSEGPDVRYILKSLPHDGEYQLFCLEKMILVFKPANYCSGPIGVGIYTA